jgi:phosphoglycerate dehydrogenase-like enzyme
MMALAHAHHFPYLLDGQREHKWPTLKELEQKPVTDLCGQRLGVLGYGAIGRQGKRLDSIQPHLMKMYAPL